MMERVNARIDVGEVEAMKRKFRNEELLTRITASDSGFQRTASFRYAVTTLKNTFSTKESLQHASKVSGMTLFCLLYQPGNYLMEQA
ncbi:hypothetical protein PsorP6_003199 [Peronosclerospora sorghi]|uniref:Uncharacterized protein n=1 Tax=Peronosclerospora sorghi TaxID=230839 RepID=A0ACC0VM56_9STRA|nr:hypothetical protein PsorP6_003199 [Peronosclerospora sorghi]